MNPLDQTFKQLAMRSFRAGEGPIKQRGEEAVAHLKAAGSALREKVRRGEVGVVEARRLAKVQADRYRADLEKATAELAPGHPMLRKLIDDRRAHLKTMAGLAGPTDLARESNGLLRSLVIEQQIANRRGEFEARGFSKRPGGGPTDKPAPMPDGLLSFLETAGMSGDEAGVEWARRTLAANRHLVFDDATRERVEAAVVRPGEIDPGAIARNLEHIEKNGPIADPGKVLDNCLAVNDLNGAVAIVASIAGGLDLPGGTGATEVMTRCHALPAAALDALRRIDGERVEAARAQAREHLGLSAAQLDREAALDGATAPTDADLAAIARSDQLLSLIHISEPTRPY